MELPSIGRSDPKCDHARDSMSILDSISEAVVVEISERVAPEIGNLDPERSLTSMLVAVVTS
jgi:hypothetical protein